jgi:hypothetical protein
MSDFDKNSKNEDIEFDEVENYSNKEQQFSHQNLIMKCLNKCAENGALEMVEGRIESKVDSHGNISTKYITDTRRQFIESVKTAKNFLKCDFTKDCEEKISKLLKKVEDNKKSWLDAEFNWWESLDYNVKQNLTLNGKNVVRGIHNQNHIFLNNSIIDEIEIWREILEELNILTKELKFYEPDTYTA